MIKYKKDQRLSMSEKQLTGFFRGEYYTQVGNSEYGFSAGEFHFIGKHSDMIKLLNKINMSGYFDYDMTYDEFSEYEDDFGSEEKCRKFYFENGYHVTWDYEFQPEIPENLDDEFNLRNIYEQSRNY